MGLVIVRLRMSVSSMWVVMLAANARVHLPFLGGKGAAHRAAAVVPKTEGLKATAFLPLVDPIVIVVEVVDVAVVNAGV
jgi:hypothetical protein